MKPIVVASLVASTGVATGKMSLIRRIVAASLLAISMLPCAGSAQAPAEQQPAPSPTPALRNRLTDDAIKQAVRDTLAETTDNQRQPKSDTLRADKHESLADSFAKAKTPDCLGPDSLKFQPTGVEVAKGWYFGFFGVFNAPFVAIAKLRGKCL